MRSVWTVTLKKLTNLRRKTMRKMFAVLVAVMFLAMAGGAFAQHVYIHNGSSPGGGGTASGNGGQSMSTGTFQGNFEGVHNSGSFQGTTTTMGQGGGATASAQGAYGSNAGSVNVTSTGSSDETQSGGTHAFQPFFQISSGGGSQTSNSSASVTLNQQ